MRTIEGEEKPLGLAGVAPIHGRVCAGGQRHVGIGQQTHSHGKGQKGDQPPPHPQTPDPKKDAESKNDAVKETDCRSQHSRILGEDGETQIHQQNGEDSGENPVEKHPASQQQNEQKRQGSEREDEVMVTEGE